MPRGRRRARRPVHLLARADGGERFLTVVNASNADTDFAWFAKQAEALGRTSRCIDRSADYAMLALQGPEAVAHVRAAARARARCPAASATASATVAGADALVCRTGYTGEDGVELLLAPADATRRLATRSSARARRRAGLGARDTLRLEVCYPLYGNDLSTERTPIEAGLGWACALDKDFIGAERLREQARAAARTRSSRRSSSPSQGIPRAGCAVLSRRASRSAR